MLDRFCPGLIVFTMLTCSAVARPAAIISPQEAALPPSRHTCSSATQYQSALKRGADDRGGTSRKPDIKLLSPGSAPVGSPLLLRIAFTAHGGSQIDPTKTSVTYLKTPEIDLTTRLKLYISENGIEVPEAEIPPGKHIIEISVSDREGNTTQTALCFVVASR